MEYLPGQRVDAGTFVEGLSHFLLFFFWEDALLGFVLECDEGSSESVLNFFLAGEVDGEDAEVRSRTLLVSVSRSG